jgi:hypothetical protein
MLARTKKRTHLTLRDFSSAALLVPTTGLISHKPSRIAQVKNAEKAARVNYVFLGHTANIMWYLGRPAFPLFAFAVACNLQRGDEVAALRPKANPAWRCVTAHLCHSDGHRRGQYSLHPCRRRSACRRLATAASCSPASGLFRQHRDNIQFVVSRPRRNGLRHRWHVIPGRSLSGARRQADAYILARLAVVRVELVSDR